MVNQSIDELERIANHTIDPSEDVSEQDMVIVCGDLLALIKAVRAAQECNRQNLIVANNKQEYLYRRCDLELKLALDDVVCAND